MVTQVVRREKSARGPLWPVEGKGLRLRVGAGAWSRLLRFDTYSEAAHDSDVGAQQHMVGA